MRLLFVENHATFAAIVVDKFLADHAVTITPSVVRALKLVASQTFDAILVDYDLDDGKGSELVRTLRERGYRVPVIAVSAHAEGNAELMRAGADAHCPKLRFAQIAGVLATVCAHRSA